MAIMEAGAAGAVSATKRAAPRDLSDPNLYLNRELTWLEFNKRVLAEARDPRTPLLERVKFVSIVCSNLDEFFMKRIGGLKQQVGAGVTELSVDGRAPSEQIHDCHEVIRQLEEDKLTVFAEVRQALDERGIHLAEFSELSASEKESLRDFYYDNILALVTPQGIDPAHPFPFISNLSLNLLVSVRTARRQSSLARVKVPLGPDVPRFLRVDRSLRFVRLEDVMANNLDMLFPRMEIQTCELFRVTRNAVTEMDEEQADDLLAMIETELRYRRFAEVVRLQVQPEMSPEHRGMLAYELGLDQETDVFVSPGMVGKSSLMEIAALDLPELHDPPHHPLIPPLLENKSSIFYNIRKRGPVMLFHPYDAFSGTVERFLEEASNDAKVRAIKMTLYRTSKRSKVIRSLINASRNGKQVAVVVELKARFDEAANIQWANQLEEAGIHVSYGVVGLKTHAKTILVVRSEPQGLRRYAHVGTGNYNSVTARIYSDLGLLTCNEDICRDLSELFNFLTTGFAPYRDYSKVLVAPTDMKKAILAKIKRECGLGEAGRIRMKTNALEDPDVTRALYEASQAGVQVDLIIRDTCRLRPGLPGFSENVRVISIVGRFLEHARIYHFGAGGQDEYYIGSADIMKRNLESRVELLVPIEGADLVTMLDRILETQLNDRRSAWEMQSDGSYVQRRPQSGDEEKSSQIGFMDWANRRRATYRKPLKVKAKSKMAKLAAGDLGDTL